MSKITRPDSIVHFAEDFQTNEMTIYGEVNSPVLDNMVQMVNDEYYRGWGINDPVTDPNPYIQDFNAFAYTISLYNGYVFQEGFVDYNTSQTYYKNAITKYNGEVYISLLDDNKGNLPDNTGGTASYALTWSQTEQINNREALISMTGGYLVRYKEAGTDEFVLHQYLENGSYSTVGTTPATFQTQTMRIERLTDTKFIFTQGNVSTFYIYEVNKTTGQFTQLLSQGFGAGFTYGVTRLPSFDGKIRFLIGNSGVALKIYEFDDALNTISDVTFSFNLPSAFNEGCIVNEDNGKIAIFEVGVGAKIYTFDVTGFTDDGGNTTNAYSTNSILRQIDNDAFMIFNSGDGSNDGIAIILVDESSNVSVGQDLLVGPDSGNTQKGFDATNPNTITVLDNITNQIDTYFGGIQLKGWRKQRADELAFDGNDNGFESNNVSDAIKELLDKILPVGKVVHFATNDDPNTIYPIGVWEQIEGKFLVGQDVSDPNFDTIGQTGGSFEFTVSRDGWGSLYYGSSPTTEGRLITGTGDAESTETWQSFGEAQNDQTVLYAPPYRVVKIWKRVS